MTTVLDANVLIAAMDTKDEHHGVVSDFLRRVVTTDSLYVPTLTLAEVLVGQVRCGRGEQAEAAIAAIGVTVMSCESLEALRLATLRVATGLKMPDCVVLAAALDVGASLATTDKTLAREAAKCGVTLAL
ncbi:MAG: PIN domain-containing protein [Propionibacteriaceae bacterium]|nr:PIN domain-containing protein [Propionibacteriaceae bacterium]